MFHSHEIVSSDFFLSLAAAESECLLLRHIIKFKSARAVLLGIFGLLNRRNAITHSLFRSFFARVIALRAIFHADQLEITCIYNRIKLRWLVARVFLLK